MMDVDSLNEWIKVNQLCCNQVQNIRKFVVEYTKTNRKNRKRVMLISILLRISVNLTSVGLLAKFMVVNKIPINLKLSVGILLRNCYMDALLGLYLSDKEEEQVAEIAEVLNADYAKSLLDQYEVYRDKFDEADLDEDFLKHAYSLTLEDNYLQYLELIDIATKMVPKKEQCMWKELSSKKKKALNPKRKVMQELKLKTIKEALDYSDVYAGCADNLYAYYKYFSQYEHFSESGYGNSIVPSEGDNVNMVKAVERLVEAIDLIRYTGLLAFD